jgi:hypothetical protein
MSLLEDHNLNIRHCGKVCLKQGYNCSNFLLMELPACQRQSETGENPFVISVLKRTFHDYRNCARRDDIVENRLWIPTLCDILKLKKASL